MAIEPVAYRTVVSGFFEGAVKLTEECECCGAALNVQADDCGPAGVFLITYCGDCGTPPLGGEWSGSRWWEHDGKGNVMLRMMPLPGYLPGYWCETHPENDLRS